jgi:hypothetical protein
VMPLHLFGSLRVRDFRAPRPWYERLLGEPRFFPHATRRCGRSQNTGRLCRGARACAGTSVATIVVGELDANVVLQLH